MKNKLNVIQIKGIKGLIIAGVVVCCLAAGFIGFPGLVLMKLWNLVSEYVFAIPQIGVFQGILLWGIILASYFTFRKERVVVCMKSPQALSDEELKAVFADIKRQSMEDPILQAMMRAREAELKYKAQENSKNVDQEQTTSNDSANV